MSETARVLLGRPDPGARQQKAAWRRACDLLSETVETAFLTTGVADRSVSVVSDDPELARALGSRLTASAVHVGLDTDAVPEVLDDAVVLVVPYAAPVRTRLALIASAFHRTRPGGHLVLLCTVVPRPGDDAPVPSMTELVEEIHHATGTAVATTDIRSIRWWGEPVTRSVMLTARSLAVPGGSA